MDVQKTDANVITQDPTTDQDTGYQDATVAEFARKARESDAEHAAKMEKHEQAMAAMAAMEKASLEGIRFQEVLRVGAQFDLKKWREQAGRVDVTCRSALESIDTNPYLPEPAKEGKRSAAREKRAADMAQVEARAQEAMRSSWDALVGATELLDRAKTRELRQASRAGNQLERDSLKAKMAAMTPAQILSWYRKAQDPYTKLVLQTDGPAIIAGMRNTSGESVLDSNRVLAAGLLDAFMSPRELALKRCAQELDSAERQLEELDPAKHKASLRGRFNI